MKHLASISTIFSFILGLFLLSPITTHAEAVDKMVDVKKNNNELTITVEKPADYYKIYKDKELVYEGKNNVYKETMDYEKQKYKVGIFKNDKLEDVVSLKVTNQSENATENNLSQAKMLSQDSNESEDEQVKEQLRNAKLETSVSDDSVTIEWPSLPDDDGVYTIYRDGKQIATTKNLSYTDVDLNSDTEYTYTVEIKHEVSDEKKKEIIEKNNLSGKKLTEEEKDTLYNLTGTISTLVKTSNNTEESLLKDEVMDPIMKQSSSSSMLQKSFPTDNEFSLDYRTFIPFKSVKNPNPLSDIDYLQGDNRSSFAEYSDKYRTESSVVAMFKNPTALTLWKDVHATHSCSTAACSNPKYVDTASDDGITLSKYVVSSSKMQFAVNHNVGIPLAWFYPKIDYYYLATLTPKSFEANGEHDKAPNHELYLNYPSGSTKIHTFGVNSQNDFLKLFGVQTTWSFDM